MKTRKEEQLRVRLTTHQRRALEKMLKERDQNETLSDLVREIIEKIISPSSDHVMCPITCKTWLMAEQVACMLDRPPVAVVEQALQNLFQMMQSNENYELLIVQEYRLRDQYKKGIN